MVSLLRLFFLGGGIFAVVLGIIALLHDPVWVKPKMFIRWPQKFSPEYFGAQRRLSDCMGPGSCGCKLSSNHHCSIAALYC